MKIDYKRIFKKKKTRYEILHFLQLLPDGMMIRIQYFIKLGRWLNLKKPKTFQEKIQWLKLYYHNPLMKICADKYRVREYIYDKGYGNILNELYQHVLDANDIDFSSLPKEFVAKVSNGSGTNIIVRDKEKLDKEWFVNKLNSWKESCKKKSVSREWAYDNNNPSIIVEKILHNEIDDLYDYKFLTYHGRVEYIVFDIGRFKEHKRNIYNRNWELIEAKSEYSNYEMNIEKPKCLGKMIEIAEKLGGDFPFVRIDLYQVMDKIYFGEMTFYPWSGYENFMPLEFNYIMGEKIDIESLK